MQNTQYWIAALSALLLTSCDCQTGTQKTYGHGAWLPKDGLVVTGDEAVLDFGTIHFDSRSTVTVSVINDGRAAVELSSPAGTTPFEREPLSAQLSSTESVSWALTFAPVAESDELSREFQQDIAVRATGGASEQTLVLHLRGVGFKEPVVLRPCELFVTPTRINFGLLARDETREESVQLQNTGDEPCGVSLAVDDGGVTQGFSLASGTQPSFSIDGGATIDVSITATGMPMSGPQEGRLEIAVEQQASQSVVLQATTNACVVVIPSPVDFPPLPIGCRMTRTVTAYNLCDVSQSLSRAVTESSLFTVESEDTILDAGAAYAFTVGFQPIAVGPVSAEFVASVPGGDMHTELSGSGAEGQTTETFVVTDKLDLLFVGAIFPYYLDANDPDDVLVVRYNNGVATMQLVGELLFRELVDAGFDLRAGAVSSEKHLPIPAALVRLTDGGVPEGYVVSTDHSADARFGQLLETMSSQAMTCRFAPLEMATRAMTPPVILSANHGFRRSGVPLNIVVASAVDDMSSGEGEPEAEPPYGCLMLSPTIPMTTYLEELGLEAGHIGAVSSVIRDPAVCPDDSYPDPWARLPSAAAQTGGATPAYCHDAGYIANDLMAGARAATRTFELQGNPNTASPIVVSVDGVPLSPLEWTYFPVTKGLRVLTDVPTGAHVTVTYFPICE